MRDVTAVRDTGVVVTGAARGIGRALAEAFAAAGARVVVNDRDDRAVEEVAEAIGAIAIAGDAASEDGVTRLVELAEAELGALDVYCANAGIETGAGLDSPALHWDSSWQVNVMAHVRAAQLLVPRWLDQGRGRFIATASAAGLLSMVGSAPYSVSKHASVAFAEWLSLTYRHRGIIVQAICPQGVRTAMLDAASKEQQTVLSRDEALEPADVAAALLRDWDDAPFLVLPHPQVAGYFQSRAADVDRWLDGMNRLQRTLETTPTP